MTGNSVLAEAYKKAPVDDMKIIMPFGLLYPHYFALFYI